MKASLARAARAQSDEGLSRYMAEVSRHPVIGRAEEQALARKYVQSGCLLSAHQLVVANLRFVVKLAHEYRSYGLRMLDLIQEGNVGLMVAVKKFDPERGYRLISYAVWWIRAHMQSFILRSWSLVRVGSSRLQRKLFFRLRAERARAQAVARGESKDLDGFSEADASTIDAEVAARLGVSAEGVADMGARLAARDFSLDAPVAADATTTFGDRLEAPEADGPEAQLDRAQADQRVAQAVRPVIAQLNDKEQHIVAHRLMADEPQSLQAIGDVFQISRERVRQLETRVKARLKAALAACPA
jgi:RNA polymerase sigma-32 factor